MRKLRRRVKGLPPAPGYVDPYAPKGNSSGGRMVYNHSLGDFVMLPGIPNKSLDIAPGTTALVSQVGDQAGMPIPDNMLPALPITTGNGYYAGSPYIKSWDGTSVVGACSPYPSAPCGACGPNSDIIPITTAGGVNNSMVNGEAFVSEDMMRDMLPGGSMAIGAARPVNVLPDPFGNPFAFDLTTAPAATKIQKAADAVYDPLVGLPTTAGLVGPNQNLSFQGGTVSTTPLPSETPNLGRLSDMRVISERNALGRLGDVTGKMTWMQLIAILGIGWAIWYYGFKRGKK